MIQLQHDLALARACLARYAATPSIGDRVIMEPFGDFPDGCGGSIDSSSQNLSYELNQEAHIDFLPVLLTEITSVKLKPQITVTPRLDKRRRGTVAPTVFATAATGGVGVMITMRGTEFHGERPREGRVDKVKWKMKKELGEKQRNVRAFSRFWVTDGDVSAPVVGLEMWI
ncbi:hypothetical protein V6N12_026905 [Hibiscus sabdariffa]|uniref:Uncharacterized protein n=1 Tax=Hibiscus sabdariffa TaxID=183260 RepID=A0ABR2DT47_9ROSI